MIQVTNNLDSSFYEIAIEGISKGAAGQSESEKFITDQVISFSITEEMGAFMNGSIQLYDDDKYSLSYILKRGTRLRIWWGYRNRDIVQKTAYAMQKNPGEIFSGGQLSRYASAYALSPSWTISDNGKIVYNCNFRCYEVGWNSPGVKWYTNTTKGGVIRQSLAEIGIATAYIDFPGMNDKVAGYTGIRRAGVSIFKFINNQAMEWRCVFRIGYHKETKQPVAIFCAYTSDSTIQSFVRDTTGALGVSVLWEWKDGLRNVMSGSIKNTEGEGGVGDNVRITIVNGQPQVFRTKAGTETVQYEKLNIGKMQKEMKELSSLGAQTELFTQWLQSADWSAIEKYFEKCDAKTAPEGIGLEISLETIGNPLCTAPARAVFGLGFPDVLRTKGLVFYHRSVDHRIDNGGYKNTVNIVDSYTVMQGSFVG